MNRHWKILERKLVYQGFFNIELCHFEHELYAGGKTSAVERELFSRGNVAAVLPYDPTHDSVVLVEQFRLGAMNRTHPWLTEVIAGMVEPGEEPMEMVHREAKEEAGLTLGDLFPIANYLASPGNTTEEVFIYGSLTDLSGAGGHYGLAEENEDIRVLHVGADEAIAMLDNGTICNALSVIAMQWFKANIESLRSGGFAA